MIKLAFSPSRMNEQEKVERIKTEVRDQVLMERNHHEKIVEITNVVVFSCELSHFCWCQIKIICRQLCFFNFLVKLLFDLIIFLH